MQLEVAYSYKDLHSIMVGNHVFMLYIPGQQKSTSIKMDTKKSLFFKPKILPLNFLSHEC